MKVRPEFGPVEFSGWSIWSVCALGGELYQIFHMACQCYLPFLVLLRGYLQSTVSCFLQVKLTWGSGVALDYILKLPCPAFLHSINTACSVYKKWKAGKHKRDMPICGFITKLKLPQHLVVHMVIFKFYTFLIKIICHTYCLQPAFSI